MALSDEKKRGYVRRLLLCRMRLLCDHGFFGLLLMHMKYAVDESVPTACTDGVYITFGTAFLDTLSDSELDFVMMHEIMHVVLAHVRRVGERDGERFNIACDIVVNSTILYENKMDCSSITLKKYGESMHLAPNGEEGYLYTAEQVYEMLPGSRRKKKKGNTGSGNSQQSGAGGGKDSRQGNTGSADAQDITGAGSWDDHSRWGTYADDTLLGDIWVKRFEEACEAISVRDPDNTRGLLPLFARRLLGELHEAVTDWRTVLSDFVQEEICDYSFCPPDRRFGDSPFMLPDFNEKDDRIDNVLFMVDTSGSISDDMIASAYSEMVGAIEQFGGRMSGWLGFFDAAIIEPKPFTSADELKVIRPAGGGGTDFSVVFEYVKRYMSTEPPSSIVILTDGIAPFPPESCAMGIPVLWLINNDRVEVPWGRVARIKQSADKVGI